MMKTGQARSAVEMFVQVEVSPNLQHKHTFGCPVYVSDGKIQSGSKGKKWSSRSRLGIYLGQLIQYVCKESLVLSLSSGLVSPQFHVIHDDDFDTLVKYARNSIPSSQWQIKCGFVSTDHKENNCDRAIPTRVRNNPATKGGTVPDVTAVPIDNIMVQVPEETLEPEGGNIPEQGMRNDHMEQEVQEEGPVEPVVTTRSGRQVRVPVKLRDYMVYSATQFIQELQPETDYRTTT
jgi:hypothetical protein